MKYLRKNWLGVAASLALASAALGQSKELVKCAYLGVATAPVSEAIANERGLEEGIGLIVNQVDPNAPANGNLELNDVIEQFDDQLLMSREQLSVLVRRKDPGSDVTLKVRRDGNLEEVVVTLAEKEMPKKAHTRKAKDHFGPAPVGQGVDLTIPGGGMLRIQMPDADAFEAEMSETMEQLTKALTEANLDMNGIFERIRPLIEGDGNAFENMDPQQIQQQFQKLFPKNGTFEVEENATSSSTFVDGGLKITVTETNGHKTLEAEQDGEKLFDGAINNEEERSKVPAEVMERVKEMENFQQNGESTTPEESVPNGS